MPVGLIVELTSDIQRMPDDSRERPILGVAGAADQHRCDDRFGRVQGRARARPARAQVLMADRAAPSLAAPAAGHRHVGRGQIDRARRARGYGLGLRRQPPLALLNDFVHGERAARPASAGRGGDGRAQPRLRSQGAARLARLDRGRHARNPLSRLRRRRTDPPL